MTVQILRRKVPALVGLTEAARILGVQKGNLRRMRSVPEPLNERGIEGFEVGCGPLWPRAEIDELARKLRKERGHTEPD